VAEVFPGVGRGESVFLSELSTLGIPLPRIQELVWGRAQPTEGRQVLPRWEPGWPAEGGQVFRRPTPRPRSL